jgi:hypothetical protein
VAASLPDANGIALPASTGSDLPSRRRRGAWWLAGGLVIVLLAISLLVKRQQRLPFEHFTIQRVSASEQVRMTAISPDGIYIASVLSEPNGAESLWVHHLPTGSERQVEQDAAIAYEDVVFSPGTTSISGLRTRLLLHYPNDTTCTGSRSLAVVPSTSWGTWTPNQLYRGRPASVLLSPERSSGCLRVRQCQRGGWRRADIGERKVSLPVRCGVRSKWQACCGFRQLGQCRDG